MKAVQALQYGGPEQLRYVEIPKPAPGPKDALVKIEAIGVNFIDIYYRTGLYKAEAPVALGMEAAGVVEAVGVDAPGVGVGDRVAYAMVRGAYAEYAVVPVNMLIPVPPGVELKVAAAAMLQGMTAHYLAKSTFPLKGGDTAVVHAAAGGVGLLLTQIAKMCGARVIGTVSGPVKAELARKAGADWVIDYTKEDFVSEVRRLTADRGADVVYDSVGVNTFMKSLDCLRPRGMMVSYGQSSGANPPFDPLILSQKGSLFLTRPVLGHYCRDREELLSRAGDVLGWIGEGKLSVRIHGEYPLAEAAQAHRDLEARKTSGKLLLIP